MSYRPIVMDPTAHPSTCKHPTFQIYEITEAGSEKDICPACGARTFLTKKQRAICGRDVVAAWAACRAKLQRQRQ